MKRHIALLVAIAALAIGAFADATSGRVPVVNRTAVTTPSTIGNLPSLKWWIEPDGIVAGDATNIDSWTDKSGNGNTLTGTTGGRPTVAASVLDGYTGATFLIANSSKMTRSVVLLSGKAFSVGLVFRVNASTDGVFLAIEDTSFQGFELAKSGANYDMRYASVSSQAENAVSTGSFHVIQYSSSGNGVGEYYYDGVRTAVPSGTNAIIKPDSTSILALGCRPANSTLFTSQTVVAAYVTDGNLPSTYREFARAYWKAKYTSLP